MGRWQRRFGPELVAELILNRQTEYPHHLEQLLSVVPHSMPCDQLTLPPRHRLLMPSSSFLSRLERAANSSFQAR